MSKIAVQLGRLRLDRHLTQQQLADRLGVRRDTISALERGKSQGIAFDTLAGLCDALSCTPNDLLEQSASAHVAPILGGEDEDAIIEERLAAVDLDALIANPALVGPVAGDDRAAPSEAAIVAWDVSPAEAQPTFRDTAEPRGWWGVAAAVSAGNGEKIVYVESNGGAADSTEAAPGARASETAVPPRGNSGAPSPQRQQ